MPSPPAKMKILLILAKNSWKKEIRFFVVRCVTWKLELILNILWMIIDTYVSLFVATYRYIALTFRNIRGNKCILYFI